ncbi:hypothetical protein GSY69_10975 [Brevibacterium sp. 5221]|uniref:Uncharacterized protein n=1 Tax=Brevibacterium rongguiense TaxID=2695267 RepID=A0A6N9HAA8_9MICO|nr:hypothetical protein [Brevibacterium rongguiense]MYM20472.1 hypothetical protein [Brevibacterium rongguiense]
MSKAQRPIERIERDHKHDVELIKKLDGIMAKIDDLDDKRARLVEERDAEVNRLLDDEEVSVAKLRSWAVPIPRRKRKTKLSTSDDASTTSDASADTASYAS